ncbi:LOW QUALITY PROTEIN: hypothetical protein Cgig2_014136 [Carnegiea gigantea]|uniref:Uncharacterized protein n=1 Tax=Carnegiea gigantea TaxID=171969 RepID=A0A9Q1JXV9_9CARY|nr:LOW QUALITY PROTEIN: hypothetical protein Cgig2_014136 [Carnegiea gigantea]
MEFHWIYGSLLGANLFYTSESSRASPRAARTSPPKREAYVTVDALKSLMSTMADAITRQVTEQVKRAIEVAGSTRPVHGEEPSHRSEEIPSLCLVERSREATRGRIAASATASTPYARHSRRTAWLEGTRGSIVNSMSKAGIPQPNFLWQEQERAPPPPRDKGCSTEIVATTVGGYVEDMTRAAWKAQLRTAWQVLTVEQGSCITAPTMVSPYNDPLGVEMKIASAIVWRILVDTGGSVYIRPGTYCLEIPQGTPIPQAWHSSNLRKYHGPGGYTSGSPPSSRPSSSDAPASASKGLVASSSPHPRTEERTPPPRDRVLPQQLVRARQQSAGRPQNTRCMRIRLQGSARPCGDRRGFPSGLAASVEAPSFRARGPRYRPVASHSISDIERRAPPAAGSPQRPSPPFAKTSAIAISSSEIFRGSEASGFASSQDLIISWTRVSFMLASALMKLAEGCEVNDKVPPAPRVAAPAPWEGVGRACGVGIRSPEDRHPDWGTDGWSTLAPSTIEGADTSVSPGGPLVLCFLQIGKLTAGLFPRGAREGACGRKLSQSQEKLRNLLGNEELTLFLPLALGSSCHLLWGSIPSFEDRQPIPRLIYTKQTRSQHQTKERSVLERLSTLSNVFEDKKTGRSKKKVIRKKLQPRLALSLHKPLHRLDSLSHKPRDRPRPVVLADIKHEISGRASLFSHRLPEGVLNQFSLIPIRDIAPTRFSAHEEEVVLPVLQFRLFLNSRHEP